MSKHYDVSETIVPLSFEYKYRVGKALNKYLDGLAKGKILGVKCAGCQRVIVPPRTVCGTCHDDMNDWVEVGPEGVLENYTVARVTIQDGDIIDADAPYVIGQVKLEGADSLLTAKVVTEDLESLALGMRVRAVFSSEPKGAVGDLEHFEPVG